MSPREFEKAVAVALSKLGWETQLTPGSGDYGADVIATCGKETLVVQCKLYGDSNTVGFSAIKEVAFAHRHFKATLAAVVFTGRLTRQAKAAAIQHDIMLFSLPELRMGCTVDRTEEGRRHRARILAERAEQERQKAQAEASEAAVRVLASADAWRTYDKNLPVWKKEREHYFEAMAWLLCGGAGVIIFLILNDTPWLAIVVAGGVIWAGLNEFGPKLPAFLNEPNGSRPTAAEIASAQATLKRTGSQSKVGSAVVACTHCRARCRIPGGRRLRVTCPRCQQIFESDLRN